MTAFTVEEIEFDIKIGRTDEPIPVHVDLRDGDHVLGVRMRARGELFAGRTAVVSVLRSRKLDGHLRGAVFVAAYPGRTQLTEGPLTYLGPLSFESSPTLHIFWAWSE